MKTFIINITETLSRNVKVRANSLEDAFSKVDEAYFDAQTLILDAEDYVDTEIQDETDHWTSKTGELDNIIENFQEVE